MTKFKYFLLNGQTFCTEHELTISDLTKYFNYQASLLVLEYNNLICNKKLWDKTFIQDNDRIEIVTIVGGG
jgi:sulfur carrier protein